MIAHRVGIGRILLIAVLGITSLKPAMAQDNAASSGAAVHVTDGSATIEPAFLMRYDGAPWDYEVRIALPRSYAASDRHYPVLWVMDGSWNFEGAVSVVSTAGKAVPEMIVVSVGVPVAQRAQTGQRRTYDFTSTALGACEYGGTGADLARKACEALYGDRLPQVKTGGAPDFLSFLAHDVRGRIEERYRVSGENLLFGFSAGGNFCTYALLSDPALFDKYICGSPSLTKENSVLFQMEQDYAATHSDLKADVFFSAGSGELTEGWLVSAAGVASSMARMAEILSLRSYPSLNLHARILPDQVHNGPGWQASLYQGLRALYPPESK
ncbi:MAG: alpha/beta hydrolase-fold protein [Blastomonas sp.]